MSNTRKNEHLDKKYVYVKTGEEVKPYDLDQIQFEKMPKGYFKKWIDNKEIETAHARLERERRRAIKLEMDQYKINFKDLPKHHQIFEVKQFYYSIPNKNGIHKKIPSDLISKIKVRKNSGGKKYYFLEINTKIVKILIGRSLQNKYYNKIKNKYYNKIKNEHYYAKMKMGDPPTKDDNQNYQTLSTQALFTQEIEQPKLPVSNLCALSIFNSKPSQSVLAIRPSISTTVVTLKEDEVAHSPHCSLMRTPHPVLPNFINNDSADLSEAISFQNEEEKLMSSDISSTIEYFLSSFASEDKSIDDMIAPISKFSNFKK